MKIIEQIDIQTQTVKWLYDLDKEGLLEVDNSFQRNYVWTPKNQIKLIESVIVGYPIPEIYLWNTGTNEDSGDTKYSIIDGQQRCGAIFQYIRNSFKLTANQLNPSYSRYEEIKGRLFKDLEAEDKKAIWSYVFSVRLVRNNVIRDKIVDMFLRLNSNNMTLNPQELRNAEFEGEFMTLAGELADLDFWTTYNFFSPADRRRMGDINFISVLLSFLISGINEDTKNDSINRMYDLYNDEYLSKENDRAVFTHIVSQIARVVDTNQERTKILKRRVHFYTLFTVTYALTLGEKQLDGKCVRNYQNFIDNYDNDDLLNKYFDTLTETINDYKRLTLEGTANKKNRFERHECIMKIMQIEGKV